MKRAIVRASAGTSLQSMLVLLTTLSLCKPSDKSLIHGSFGVLCFANPSNNMKPITRGALKPVASTFKSQQKVSEHSFHGLSPRTGMTLSSGSTTSATIDIDRNEDNASLLSTADENRVQIQNSKKIQSFWPSGDELDQRLIRIALPCIANFAINPLISAIDLIWINRIGNPLAIAGQAAANQVFNSLFWLTSFLPSGT